MLRLTPTTVAAVPRATPDDPLRVLVSGCLAGWPCGVDGTNYGEHAVAVALLALPNVRAIPFCPEQHAFGTPRATPDIHGGDGFDVLDGRARVVADTGEDWTEGMLAAAREMARVAREARVHVAFLTDISAACGSGVIYDGARRERRYQRGVGVAAAMLMRDGIPVVSHRAYRTLEALRHHLDPAHAIDPDARDHHETEWYRGYFG